MTLFYQRETPLTSLDTDIGDLHVISRTSGNPVDVCYIATHFVGIDYWRDAYSPSGFFPYENSVDVINESNIMQDNLLSLRVRLRGYDGCGFLSLCKFHLSNVKYDFKFRHE